MSNVKIVSDGTSQGTKVFVGDSELKGVTFVSFDISANDSVSRFRIEGIASKVELYREASEENPIYFEFRG